MAIFWNHIKGTGNATNNGDGLWTWIEWSKPESITAIPTTLTNALSPEIKIRIGNGDPDKDETKSLGNIITTNANITTSGNWISDHPDGAVWEWKWDTNIKFKMQALDDGPTFYTFGSTLWKQSVPPQIEEEGDYISVVRLVDSEDKSHDVLAWGLEKIQAKLPLYNTKLIHTDDKCEALYFNATSDKRAKENIAPATFSGLDLINKLSLYTFNYKDKTDVVPGILAQDLLEVQPEELNLVDNIAATGENGDYMSIKESKLIFVLMQAIKEQQAQIEDLKAQIKNLTK